MIGRMATLAQIRTRLDQAVTARDASDYAACLRHLDAVSIMLIGLPTSEFDGDKQDWEATKTNIHKTIAQIRQQAMADQSADAGGIVSLDITYKRC